jgi:hypothetical protein
VCGGLAVGDENQIRQLTSALGEASRRGQLLPLAAVVIFKYENPRIIDMGLRQPNSECWSIEEKYTTTPLYSNDREWLC